MNTGLFAILSKIADLFVKKSESGEKTQEIQEVRLNVFKKCLVNVLYVLIGLIALTSLFPTITLSDYAYNIFDKILDYMLQ